jgi:integrase
MAGKRTHGSGTIVRRPNGRYTAQRTDPRTGRRESLGTFDTRRQAERAIAEAVVGPASGDGEQVALGEYLAAWVEQQRPYLKPTTVDGYTVKARTYVLPHPIAQVRLGALRPDDFRRHYAMLAERGGRDGGPLGDWSVSGVDRMLRAAVHAALRDGLIVGTNPLPDRRVRVERREQPWAPVEQVRRLLLLVRVADPELEPAVRLAALYGWRRSELAGLTWADVDLAGGTVRIRRTRVATATGRAVASDGKTAGSRATVPIDEATAAALAAHLERRRELIEAEPEGEHVYVDPFGRPLYPDTLTERFARVVRAYNVTHADAPLPAGFTLQSLRHSFASIMVAAGESTLVVAAALRHSSPRMVEATYGHLAPSTVADAVGRLAAAVDDHGPSSSSSRARSSSSSSSRSR